MPSTPAFMPLYTTERAGDLKPAMDATLTIEPPRCGSIASAAAWMPQITDLKPISTMRSITSGVISASGW